MPGWSYKAGRGRTRIGPFVINWVVNKGITSIGHKLGPWTRNYTHGTDTVDLPGSYTGRIRRRYRKR